MSASPIFSFARVTYIPFGEAETEENFRPFEHEDRILGLSVENNENDLPVIRMKLKNSDLKMFEHPILAKHSLIGVRFFRDNYSGPRYSGLVSRIRGNWEVEIEATDLVLQSHFDNGVQVQPVKEGQSRKDKALTLIKKLGFTDLKIELGEVSTEKKEEGERNPDNLSVWGTLQSLAEKDHASIIVIGREKFFFGKRKFKQAPVARFELQPKNDENDDDPEVIDWNVEDDLMGKTGEFTVAGYKLLTKEPLKAEANGDNTERTVLGSETGVFPPGAQGSPAKTEAERVSDDRTRVRTTSDRDVRVWKIPSRSTSRNTVQTAAQTQAEANNQAKSNFRAQEELFIGLTLVLRFRPDMVPGIVIEFANAGPIYSGKYYVAGVTQSLEDSAATSMTCIRNAMTRTPSKVSVPPGDAATNNQATQADTKKLQPTKIRVSGEDQQVFRRL